MGVVYGPVMSWRFGRSLGIDAVPPPKMCTFNCCYCQLGPTKIPVKSPESVQELLPNEKHVLHDLQSYLRQISVASLDVVTFSGSGEPSLNLQLAAMVNTVREWLPQLPVVLLTNGSLLDFQQVLRNLCVFDIITVKFDAGDDETHQAINRPVASFRHDQLVRGLHELRKSSNVTIALEVMLLRLASGVSNIEGKFRESLMKGLMELASVVDVVQLYTPWRPPGEEEVEPIEKSELQDFASELYDRYNSERIWIYGVHDARTRAAAWKSHQSLRNDVLRILQRRPCTLKDLVHSLDIPAHSLMPLISQLRRTNSITVKQHLKEAYYLASI